jgi:hypothetical protein
LADDFVQRTFTDEEFFQYIGKTVTTCSQNDKEISLHCIYRTVILATVVNCDDVGGYVIESDATSNPRPPRQTSIPRI